MNWLDKAILWQLFGNARISTQDLARKFNLSFNAIKNRVKKLEEIGAIQEYTVELSMAMLGLETIEVHITTDGSENMKSLIDQIGSHQSVRMAYRGGNKKYCAVAVVAGTKDFFALKGFLESLDAVIDVRIHPTVGIAPDAPPNSKARSHGRKVVFTQNQLQVLRCLTGNVRMPVGKISKRTKLTPRRVSKILHELHDGGGVHLTIRINMFAFGDVALELSIRFDEEKTTVSEIVSWFREHYPQEFWNAVQYLDEPRIGISLIIDDLKKVGEITSIAREASFVEEVDDYIIAPQTYVKLHYRDPSQHRLEEMFKEAGL
ncbi:MAG: Lrp/AsnC family transcriptional regulator [Promethearchaeota archaeon]